MKNIPRLAKLMTWTTASVMVIILSSFALIWLNHDRHQEVFSEFLSGIEKTDIPGSMLFLGFLLSSVLLAILLYGLFQLIKFFRLYYNGDLFPGGAGNFLSRFGIALVFLVPAKILVFSISSVLFSLHLPAGKKQLAVAISSNELLLLVVGGLIYMVGHLLNSANEVAEENRHII